MNYQEQQWAGEFGNFYTDRCCPAPTARTKFFKNVFEKLEVNSVCEIGANKGSNLIAINQICNSANLTAVEINKKACAQLPSYVTIHHCSLFDFVPPHKYDLILSSGFLIHVSDQNICSAYEKLFILSNKYILLIEYYSPTPVVVPYRGDDKMLFIRDFAFEMVDALPLHVINYGFLWKKNNPSWDNVHWWLLQKNA